MKIAWTSKKVRIAIIAGMFICICVVLLLVFNSKDTKEPVTAEYNIKTGIVTF